MDRNPQWRGPIFRLVWPAAAIPDDKEHTMQIENPQNTPRIPGRRSRLLAMSSAAAIAVVGLGAFALLPPVRQIEATTHDPVQIAANEPGHAPPRMLENSAPFSFADLVERVS